MSSYYYPVYNNELYHFGTKRHSGRYPWGSGDRPYQSTGGVGPGRKPPMSKEEAIKSGSARDVLKFQGQLTNQELQTAVTRLNLESQLKNIDTSIRKKGKKRSSKLLSDIGSKVLIPIGVGAASLAAKYEIDKFMRGYFGDSYADPETQRKLAEIFKELFKGVNVIKK